MCRTLVPYSSRIFSVPLYAFCWFPDQCSEFDRSCAHLLLSHPNRGGYVCWLYGIRVSYFILYILYFILYMYFNNEPHKPLYILYFYSIYQSSTVFFFPAIQIEHIGHHILVESTRNHRH